ncbi:MAG: hypothetical protein ACI4Q3_01000 [Kiritimatiellia bacterium]
MKHANVLAGLSVLVAAAVWGAQPSGNVALAPADGETIRGGAFPGGTIDVAAGTVTMTGSDDEVSLGDCLDPALTNLASLAFWVDAGLNCVTDENGAVVEWVDRRATFADGVPAGDHASYLRGVVRRPAAEDGEESSEIGGEPPTFKTDERFPGKRFLDFGDYGSGRWMYLADADGAMVKQCARTWYCVIGFDSANNCGHVLSTISSFSAEGGSSVYFHKGTGSSPKGVISTSTSDSCMYRGETRLDGVRIDPRVTAYKWTAFQILGQIGPFTTAGSGDPYFCTLFNDRNLTFTDETAGVVRRQGGGVLGELLVWNCVLTEDERRQVEAYLFAKWFARPTGGAATIAAGARLVVAAGATPVSLDSAQGGGTLVKQGAGTLTLERSCTPGAKLRTEEGSVVLAGSRMAPAVEPVAGRTLTVSNGVMTAGAAAQPAVAELTGQGSDSVSVDPADLSAATVRLSSMEVVLTPQNAAACDHLPTLLEQYPNLLANASFETPALTSTSVDGAWRGMDAAAHAWQTSGNAFVATHGTWYNSTNAVPDGLGGQFAAIQGRDGASGSLSQTFAAPVRGLYRMTFFMTRRTNRSESPGEVIAQMDLDGTVFFTAPVYEDYRGNIDTFKQYSAVLPPLTQDRHTLTIKVVADNVSTDRALVLDDIRIFPVAAGEFVHIPNSGCDSAVSAVKKDSANGWFRFFEKTGVEPSGAGWRGFGDDTGYWGVTRGRSSWFVDYYSSDKLVDYSKFFLQRGAFISTTVEVPRDGRVRFSLLYSNRARYYWDSEVKNRVEGIERVSGHSLVAYLDDRPMLRVDPVTGATSRTGWGELEVTAGVHTLTISNDLNGVTADVASIVDEFRMMYVDSEPGIVSAHAFAQDDSFAPSQSGEVSVSIPSNGYYQVAVSVAGAEIERVSATGVYNNYDYYPATGRVLIDGRTVLEMQVQDDVFRECRAAVYLTNGVKQVQVQCLAAGSAASARLRVADFRILPVAVPTLADPEVAKETKLELDAASKLRLDYEGTLNVAGFAVGGTAYADVVDATTLPGVIAGPGKIKVTARGTILLVR